MNVDNMALPGIQVEATMMLDRFDVSELERLDVFQDGTYVGQIVYVVRHTKRGTLYGWRAAKSASQSKLLTKVDAIRKVLGHDY